MTRLLLITSLLAFSSAFLHAGAFDGELNAPCQPGTLSSYISNESGGCSIGIVDFTNFQFRFSGNQIIHVVADDILVTPAIGGFMFSKVNGTPFISQPGETADYRILYDFAIDPAPIFDGADLALDPPSGGVTVTQYYCNDGGFVPTGSLAQISLPVRCQGEDGLFTPEILRVTPSFPETGFVAFTRPAFFFGAVLTDMELIGPAQADGVRGDARLRSDLEAVPEPFSMALGLLGVGLIALRKRLSAHN